MPLIKKIHSFHVFSKPVRRCLSLIYQGVILVILIGGVGALQVIVLDLCDRASIFPLRGFLLFNLLIVATLTGFLILPGRLSLYRPNLLVRLNAFMPWISSRTLGASKSVQANLVTEMNGRIAVVTIIRREISPKKECSTSGSNSLGG